MIRVLLAVRAFSPDYSGAAERFRGYAPGLREHGIALSVLAGTSGPPPRPFGHCIPCDPVDGIPVARVALPHTPHWLWTRPRTYLAGLLTYALKVRPDVIQLGFAERNLAPVVAALRLAGLPVVVAQTLMDGPLDDRPLKRALQRVSRTLPFLPASAVVVNSQIMADALHAQGLRRPVQVIHNGVNTARFRPLAPGEDRAALRLALGLPAGPLLLTTGAVVPRKGHALLAEALHRVPELHLAIAGPLDQAPEYVRAVQAKAPPGRLHLLGQREDVPALLQAADLFGFASAAEGLPNGVLEAMATALPVVTTPFLGLSNALGTAGETYLLAQRDAKSLADALRQALGSGKALGQAARTFVERQMSQAAAIAAYASLYRRLAR